MSKTKEKHKEAKTMYCGQLYSMRIVLKMWPRRFRDVGGCLPRS